MATKKSKKNDNINDFMKSLTKDQVKALSDVYNGGLGSGMTPEEWKAYRKKMGYDGGNAKK